MWEKNEKLEFYVGFLGKNPQRISLKIPKTLEQIFAGILEKTSVSDQVCKMKAATSSANRKLLEEA